MKKRTQKRILGLSIALCVEWQRKRRILRSSNVTNSISTNLSWENILSRFQHLIIVFNRNSQSNGGS